MERIPLRYRVEMSLWQFIPGRVTGCNYPPQPHESLWSILTRLARLNALNITSLWHLCSGHSTRQEKSLLTSSWIDTKRIAKVVDWQLSKIAEKRIEEYLGAHADVWFSTRLRICPLCLESGYHSTWHQLSSLDYCPIHRCELTECCQSCGKHLSRYSYNIAHFRAPLMCPTCHGPISGTGLELELLNDFRAHPEQLVVFDPFSNWLKQFAHEPINPVKLIPSSFVDWQGWCRPNLLRLSLAQKLIPLPTPVVPKVYSDITMLRWKIRMASSASWRNQRRDYFPALTSVLRIVLRRLVIWILKTNPKADLRAISAPALAPELDLSSWEPRLLAYHLFCSLYCTPSRQRIGVASDLWMSDLRKLPELSLRFWEARLPRLGFRALLFGLYVG